MGIKQSIDRLLDEPDEMRFDEVNLISHFLGFRLKRVRGSHFCYFKEGSGLLVIPVHGKKVTKYYLRNIKRILQQL